MVENLRYIKGFLTARLLTVSQYITVYISVYEMNKKRTKSRESAKKMIPRRPLKKIDSKSTCTHKKGFHFVVTR